MMYQISYKEICEFEDSLISLTDLTHKLSMNKREIEIRGADTTNQPISALVDELQKLKSIFFEIFPPDGYDKAYDGISEKHAERLRLRREITAQETREFKARVNKDLI